MITALFVIFLVICISMVSFVAVAYSSSAIGFGVVAESSTSLLSTAYLLLLFTTPFDSGQRLFLPIAFGVAVHFKQHSSLIYQNPSFFIGQRMGGSRNYGFTDLWNHGTTDRAVAGSLLKNSLLFSLLSLSTCIYRYFFRTLRNG